MAGMNHPGGERTDFGDESVSELVQRASRQTADLIRQELRLAQTELKEKGRRIGIGAALVVIGGILALVGRRKAAEGLPPTPEQAMASMHDDLQHIKEKAGR